MATLEVPVPSTAAPPATEANRVFGYILQVAGGLLMVGGICSAITFAVLPFGRGSGTLANNTAVAAFGAICVAYGALTGLVGWGLVHNRLRASLQLPPPLIFIGGFFIAVLVGQLILSLDLATPLLFPLWHILASLFIPLAVLSYALRKLGPVSARSLLAQITWGGLATVFIALILEVIAGFIIVVAAVALLFIALGPEKLSHLVRELTRSSADTETLSRALLAEPAAVIVLGSAVLVIMTLLVPLIEEIAKSLGPAMQIYRRKPGRSAAVLWGLAAGAGYAFTENLLNAQGGVAAPESAFGLWGGAMILRGGTSLIHIAATGTIAIGWYSWLVQGKFSQFIWLLAAAVLVHGIWNGLALALGAVSTLFVARQGAAASPLAALAMTGILCLLGGLLLGSGLWVRAVVRWGARPDSPSG